MVDRIPFEGHALRLASMPVRSDLAVKAPPSSAELPSMAVSGVSESQNTSTEEHADPDSHAAIGQIWRDMDKIKRNEQRQKELDQIRLRLAGNRDAIKNDSTFGAERDLEADLEAISSLAQDSQVISETPVLIIGQREETSNAAERVSQADRKRVLARIEQALKNVGKLRSALASDNETAYDRLVNLNSSVNDLNLARTRVNDASFGLRSASDTVDAVMLHMRAAVVAHGKMSPELIRLVLN
jgi:hypothetical protein